MTLNQAGATRPSRARSRGVVLSGFQPFLSDRVVSQEALLRYQAWLWARAQCVGDDGVDSAGLKRAWADATDRVDRYGVSPEYIEGRTVVLAPDGVRVDGDGTGNAQLPPLFSDVDGTPAGGDVQERMRAFERVADEVVELAWAERSHPPGDIVHVTCSGYIAPNPVERLVARRGWERTTVTNCYHMGCYGAFPAVRIAAGLLASSAMGLSPGRERVDILHTEALSLHMDLLDTSATNTVISTLFGDGFIRYGATLADAHPKGTPGMEVLGWEERILPDTSKLMTWDVSAHGFKMSLSRRVPALIGGPSRELVASLAEAAGFDLEELRREACFAIHPGGPRIIEHVAKALGVSAYQVRHSKAVLQERGNMSSATVPHIWGQILADPDVAPGTPVVSLAFGPGLTATALIAVKVA